MPEIKIINTIDAKKLEKFIQTTPIIHDLFCSDSSHDLKSVKSDEPCTK